MLTVWVWIMDQVIKKIAINKLAGQKPVYYLNEKISFSLVKNRGAFLGWLKDKPAYLHIFTILSIAMILVIGIPYWTSGKGKWTGMGLALMLGGALGNYTDRIRRGYVVDYIAFAPKHTVHFNLADFAIFEGVFLMFVGKWIGK
jgi:signal peptidase II